MWCGFQVSVPELVLFLLLWKSSRSSFMGRVWWIFLSKEGSSLGPIIRYDLKLIGFCYLRSGKNISLMCHKVVCLDFYWAIFL
jgi:hypothetical protein